MKLKHIVTSICLFAISAFFVNAEVKPVEQISLENFARKYQFLEIKISPSGNVL
jgi:hypothetical protein